MPVPERHREFIFDEPPSRPSRFAVNPHLIGVAGVLIVLSFTIVVLTETGWLQRIGNRLRQVPLPSWSSVDAGVGAAGASLGDLVDSITASGRGVSELTERSFERQQGTIGGAASNRPPER